MDTPGNRWWHAGVTVSIPKMIGAGVGDDAGARYDPTMAMDPLTLVYAGMGALFTALGVPLMLGKVPPNGLYGFRTERTLANRDIWFPANRALGIDLCVVEAVVAATAVALEGMWRGHTSTQLAVANTLVDVQAVAHRRVEPFPRARGGAALIESLRGGRFGQRVDEIFSAWRSGKGLTR